MEPTTINNAIKEVRGSLFREETKRIRKKNYNKRLYIIF